MFIEFISQMKNGDSFVSLASRTLPVAIGIYHNRLSKTIFYFSLHRPLQGYFLS